MNGKELKVAELELKFGGQSRIVNVFGVFRYKPNNGLYVIYADVGTNYDYVCYGTSHVKNDTILSMSSNKPEDIEAVKEYIFKVVNDEKLDNFEIISLDNIKEIEIISSKNFEIKREVLVSLISKTIPKKEEIDNNGKDNENGVKKKKKSPLLTVLLVFLLLIIGGALYLYFVPINGVEKVTKVIYCKKTYNHQTLNNVVVDEEKTFKFNNYDKLDKLEVTTSYKFNTDDSYLDFINKSLYYNYMPDDNEDTTGSYKIDNDNKSFITYATTKIDESYGDAVEYEEVLSVNTSDNYNCEEKIEK